MNNNDTIKGGEVRGLTSPFLLAEAVEMANYYYPYRGIDSYFYRRWVEAETNLDSILDKVRGV